MDAAETYFKRAIEADPQNKVVLFNYAVFLQCEHEEMDTSEFYYKQLLAADPKDASTLCNYGQVLACQGRPKEAEEKLLAAFDQFSHTGEIETAEVCFALWLVSRSKGNDTGRWERCFKFLIQKGFKRYSWSFDRMLKEAEKVFVAEDLEYAKALAAAFLDESKVAELAKYQRWQALAPLNPFAPLSAATS